MIDTVEVKIYTDRLLRKLSRIMRILQTTKNFWCPLLVRSGIISECNAKLKDGGIIKVSRSNWANYWDYITLLHMKMKFKFELCEKFAIKFEFKRRKITLRLPEIPDKIDKFVGRILRLFYFDEYSLLSVKNRVVIDIGAWIGDTSIYFALKRSEEGHYCRTSSVFFYSPQGKH